MEYEIRPEPTEGERAVLLGALAVEDEGPYASAWRRDELESDGENGYEATARPRSSPGATRA